MIFVKGKSSFVQVFNNGICWYKAYELHREGAPAVIYSNGARYWYQHGKRHRVGGPAIELANGEKRFYIEGRIYDKEIYWGKINA